jgi:RNA polymerase sigma factor (sigma-70 family)
MTSASRPAADEPAAAAMGVGPHYEANRTRLVGFAMLLVGDLPAAEDLLHEAVAAALARPDAPEDPGAYLRAAMVNRARSRWRRRLVVQRVEPLLPRGADLFDHPPDVALWDLVRRLPDRARVVVTLRYYDRRSPREIADLLDLPVGTVSSILTRTLRRLREQLVEIDQEEQR